jgi:hypothetical protein
VRRTPIQIVLRGHGPVGRLKGSGRLHYAHDLGRLLEYTATKLKNSILMMRLAAPDDPTTEQAARLHRDTLKVYRMATLVQQRGRRLIAWAHESARRQAESN